MKATRKLIPAIAMLLVAIVLMSTASYAWFSMSREVFASGMSLTAKAPSNLLISNEIGGTYGTTAALASGNKATLYPASSWNGATGSFFTAKSITTIEGGAPTSNDDLEAVEGGDGTYYKDFTFYLKNTGDDAMNITISGLAVAGTPAGANSVRLALVNYKIGTGPDVNVTANNVLKLTGASYPTGIKGPVQALSDFKGVADGANIADAATELIPVPAVSDVVIVTVRVWFEGQDASCKNSMNMEADAFEVSFKFVDTTFVDTTLDD